VQRFLLATLAIVQYDLVVESNTNMTYNLTPSAARARAKRAGVAHLITIRGGRAAERVERGYGCAGDQCSIRLAVENQHAREFLTSIKELREDYDPAYQAEFEECGRASA
jgi:hypothetical protein